MRWMGISQADHGQQVLDAEVDDTVEAATNFDVAMELFAQQEWTAACFPSCSARRRSPSGSVL